MKKGRKNWNVIFPYLPSNSESAWATWPGDWPTGWEERIPGGGFQAGAGGGSKGLGPFWRDWHLNVWAASVLVWPERRGCPLLISGARSECLKRNRPTGTWLGFSGETSFYEFQESRSLLTHAGVLSWVKRHVGPRKQGWALRRDLPSERHRGLRVLDEMCRLGWGATRARLCPLAVHHIISVILVPFTSSIN